MISLQHEQDSSFISHIPPQAVLQTSSSSVSLPAVEWLSSSGVPALLQEKLGVSPILLDADTLAHLSIEKAVSNLLLINLPYCSQ